MKKRARVRFFYCYLWLSSGKPRCSELLAFYLPAYFIVAGYLAAPENNFYTKIDDFLFIFLLPSPKHTTMAVLRPDIDLPCNKKCEIIHFVYTIMYQIKKRFSLY